MGLELIGMIIAAFGGLAVLRSAPMALTVLSIGGLLGAASALAFGPANITPGYLSLAFFMIAIAIRPNPIKYASLAFFPIRPGLILLALTIWAIFAGYLLPRIFAGSIMAFPMSASGMYHVEEKIGPAGSNLFHTIYFFAGLVMLIAVSSMIRTNSMMRRAGNAVLIAVGLNIAIAIIDLVTYSIGLSSLLDFIRNADYAQAFRQESMIGTKRVNGSFPEPSSFAAASVGLFAFTFRLWRVGIRSRITGPLALGTLIMLFLSFSSTGFVALGAYLAVAYSAITLGTDRRGAPTLISRPNRSAALMAIPVGATLLTFVIALRPDVMDSISGIFSGTITNKLQSASGIERSNWNMVGLRVFAETYGLGAGTGAIRTSSFVVGVLANLGLIGAILYAWFFWNLFQQRPERTSPLADAESHQYAAAARAGCFVSLIAAVLSSTQIHLGIHFYIFAGMACASLFYRRPTGVVLAPQPEAEPALDMMENEQAAR